MDSSFLEPQTLTELTGAPFWCLATTTLLKLFLLYLRLFGKFLTGTTRADFTLSLPCRNQASP